MPDARKTGGGSGAQIGELQYGCRELSEISITDAGADCSGVKEMEEGGTLAENNNKLALNDKN